MLIELKNKDTLKFNDFKFKCSIGKNGIKKNKVEGDKCSPRGVFQIGDVYYRSDRISKPKTCLKLKKIRPNIGWCNNPKSKFYNKEIKIVKNNSFEKLFRKDKKYDIILVIKYNYKKVIPYKGSAIFIHLTKNYKYTAGCIALKKKDMLILLKLIKKKTKIKIN
jgi:L,D-peptidoglycan transpeptidase YkuD (ErfK/YbiS/YcfS/YnhG family)